MDKRPIGVFDSGVGGLTVVNKLFRLLPEENVIYFGDTARVPYGNKSKETITRFSKEIVEFLLGFRVKLIIVACNTASSLSLEALKRSFSVPVVGVIEPGVREALKISKKGRIGVIGTEATISSGAYKKLIQSIDNGAFVVQKSCPLFVPLVEDKRLSSGITERVAREYLKPVLDKKIDTLILGCTHYPLLGYLLRRIAGKNVKLIDSSTAVARHARGFLEKKDMLGRAQRAHSRFFASDDTKNFSKFAKVFLGKNIRAERVVF